MDSELTNKILELCNMYELEIGSLEKEYKELNDQEKKSIDDKIKLKKLKNKIAKEKEMLESLKEDLEYSKDLDSNIKRLQDIVSKTKNADAKKIVEKELNGYLDSKKEFEEEMNKKFKTIEEFIKNEEETTEEKKPIVTKRRVVSVIALLLAGGMLFGLGRCSKKTNNSSATTKPTTETYSPEPTITPTLTPTVEPTVVEGFTNLEDEEKLVERANELTKLFDELAPEHCVDVDSAIEYLNYINGGVVNETSREAALDVITAAETLMNNEMNYSVDMLNKGESGREKQTTIVDYGQFFVDESRGQKLASQISTLRSGMIGTDKETAKAKAVEFTKLLMNSWYLNGNGEISAYGLETSGMEAFIDKLFLNTAMLAQATADEEIVVINPLTGDEITLKEIIKQINNAECPLEITADNGDIFTKYVNKFSYDMEGMLKEAVYNKLAAEENYGKTLTNN